MNRRKSLGSVLETNKLSQEEQAFVEEAISPREEETPSLMVVERSAPSEVQKDNVEASESASEKRASKKPRRDSQPKFEPASLEEPKISRTFRISAQFAEALLDASFLRKKKKEQPWAQEAIVNEAIGEWLRRNGHAL